MKLFLASVTLATVLTAGLAVPAAAQPAYPAEPPEVGGPPPPPGPPERFVLEPGHWRWNGYRYRWIRRHWIAVQPGFVHFIPGHWRPNGTWAPPHWGP